MDILCFVECRPVVDRRNCRAHKKKTIGVSSYTHIYMYSILKAHPKLLIGTYQLQPRAKETPRYRNPAVQAALLLLVNLDTRRRAHQSLALRVNHKLPGHEPHRHEHPGT